MLSTISDARTDDLLVAAAKSGNERAFAVLFNRHHQLIFAIALWYTRVFEDADRHVRFTCGLPVSCRLSFKGLSVTVGQSSNPRE